MAESVETEIKSRPALSGWPMILGWLAMLIFACHASTHMVGAGDTWVAMACGRHFINHGVDTVEPFSANSHRPGPTEKDIKKWPGWAQWLTEKAGIETVNYWHPTGWVNQNWLTHVIFYWLTHLSPFSDAEDWSFNTLVYWKFAIYIITVICVYYTARLLGVNAALSAVFACFAMFIGRTFLDIRPAGFSNLLVAVFLLILVLATYRNILYIWLIVPVAVFWCNVHGGYVYLFIMLVPFVGLNLLTCISKKWFVSIGLKGIYHTVAAGFFAFLATIIFNPFHLTNLTHTIVISISKHAEMWRTVREWHPAFAWNNPVGTGFPFLVLLILSIGLPLFWLFSRFLKPRFTKAPKDELEAQEKLFNILSKISGWAAGVFICWVTFVSFSFAEVNVYSFIICAVFAGILLVSIYKNVHFIYLMVLLILLALWSANADKGYTGRYIYPFCILPGYVIAHTIASSLSKNVKIKHIDIAFVAIAAIAALVLMMVKFNPFKIEHFWDISQYAGLHRLWRPRYEKHFPMSYSNLFTALYIINVASVVVWLAVPYLRKVFRPMPDKLAQEPGRDTYQLPKMDLSLMVIAALTIYMAYRSRRFIPIAGIAACPVIAMFINEMACTISASRNFYKRGLLAVPAMLRGLRAFFIFVGVIVVAGLGAYWSIKFKYIYLDSWPPDPKLNSVFMRMTASHAKPFYACKFIKDNKLEGKMFNYWTEGGFIAWGQEPDPNTGKTPLQLFMDGRAQAAYEPKAYTVWSDIMSGGTIVQSARIRRRKLTGADYKKIGEWIDKKLKKHNVWVVLMPAQEFRNHFMQGLERSPSWHPVFYNNKQKLLVDMTTSQGRKLFEGVFKGKTVYPDKFSKNLIIAHNMFLFGSKDNEKKLGYDFAVEAFKLEPSQAPIQKIILFAENFPDLVPRVTDFCKNYFDDFTEDKDRWAKEDGYNDRAAAASIAAAYLRNIAKAQKNKELAKFYATKAKEYESELKQISRKKRW